MTLLILALLFTGLFGLLGATVLPALLAALLARRHPSPAPATGTRLSLQVLVTAHNEEATIGATLASLEQALSRTDSARPSIVVGLDHCTDRTEEIVRTFAAHTPFPVICQPKRGPAGKWRMMVELARAADADWLAFVDCGSIWDPALLADAGPHLRTPAVRVVAPSYLPQQAGPLEQINWRLEQTIKRLETWSGGPISVHGATVLYRRTALLEVFDRLEGRDCLNDDLVIPSMIRLLDPTCRVAYLSFATSRRAYVLDRGVKPDLALEYRRRRRIMHGSVEWLQLLAAQGGFRQPVFALLACRRLGRMLWSYWTSCLAAAVILFAAIHTPFGPAFWLVAAIALVALIATSNFVRRLTMAYVAALRTPFLIIRQLSRDPAKTVQWQ